MLNEATARAALEAAAQSLPPYPGGFEGRGIVICGGGPQYFPPAWVNIRMLRHLGCTLPVELWHLGPGEVNDDMRALATSLGGVICVDAFEVAKRHPARIAGGWELKCYALLRSRFREVLLLDADNFPVVDPSFLFDTPQYLQAHAVFWPDREPLASDHLIWQLTGVQYRGDVLFETGQIVVDKQRCWRELALAWWMNDRSDFWYRYILGDNKTLHLAWRKLGTPWAMPPFPPVDIRGIGMFQHDFDGRRILQHRCSDKLALGTNDHCDEFLFEKECFEFIRELRERWLALESASARAPSAG